jgi:hypothetical protein
LKGQYDDSRTIILPEAISTATAQGTLIIRAYREHLGYSVEELAVACGLTVGEIRSLKLGTAPRMATGAGLRGLWLPIGIFDVAADVSDAA